jgi:GTP-binding protein
MQREGVVADDRVLRSQDAELVQSPALHRGIALHRRVGEPSSELRRREQLAGYVLRRPLTPLDERLMDWYAPTGRPIHILLSKADKLSRQEQTKTLRAVQAELVRRVGLYSVQLFSSLKKTGIEEAEAVLAGWLGLPAPEIKRPPEKGSPGAKMP